MTALAYGLSLPSKAKTSTRSGPAPAKRKSLFDNDSEPDDDNGDDDGKIEDLEVIHPDDGAPGSPKSRGSPAPSKKSPPSAKVGRNYKNLSSKHAATTQTLDPASYEYDAVYDSLHATKAPRNVGSTPKYMQQLLNAAEVRKRDQLRAKDAMLLREREAEGADFADKEKFVTTAYKAQQEEVWRLEEEERAKEKMDAERKRREGGGGMTSFYKGIMEREEARHQAAIDAVAQNAGKESPLQQPETKSEAELAKEAGAVVNEEGSVIDKRQMLQAGLNLKTKPGIQTAKSTNRPNIKESKSMAILSGHGGSKAGMRERHSRMLEAQLQEMAKRAADDNEIESEAAKRSAKSRKTEGEILGAKERYLQRKKEAAQKEG